jgi:hypothetical protein
VRGLHRPGRNRYAAKKISGKSISNNTRAKKKLKANVLKGDVAARDCANEGLRLPDLGEGLLVTNKTALPYLWTTDVADTGPPSTRVVVRTDDSGFSRIATQAKTTPTEYVCVLNATNPPS